MRVERERDRKLGRFTGLQRERVEGQSRKCGRRERRVPRTHSTPAEVSSQESPSRPEERHRRLDTSARGSRPVPVSKRRSRSGSSSWVLHEAKGKDARGRREAKRVSVTSRTRKEGQREGKVRTNHSRRSLSFCRTSTCIPP